MRRGVFDDFFNAEELSEKVIARETLVEGEIVRFEQLSVELSNGKHSRRDIVRHPGGCVIIPVDDEGYVYLVGQYRAPFEEITLELPAGKLEPGEPPEECAVRELAEEIGMKAQSLRHMMSVMSSPGFCDEIIHVFMAKGLVPCDAESDSDEFLHTVMLPLDELLKLIMTGKISDGKTVIGALLADRESRSAESS